MPPATITDAIRGPMMYPTPRSIGEGSSDTTALLYPVMPLTGCFHVSSQNLIACMRS